MSRVEIVGRVKTIIEQNLAVVLPNDIEESSRLFEDLGIDSLMVLQLVVYIEEEFGLMIPEEDVDLSVFRTLRSLVSFIENLQSSDVV